MDIHRIELFNHALLRSLNTIQSAKDQFHGSTVAASTPTALASRIRLCEVLLAEIHAISSRLERRMSHGNLKQRRAAIVRHGQVAAYLTHAEGSAAKRAKQKR